MPDPSALADDPPDDPTVAAPHAVVPGSWALVTGGAGRGGAAMCRALHARGLSVVIHHTERSHDAARRLGAQLEGRRLAEIDGRSGAAGAVRAAPRPPRQRASSRGPAGASDARPAASTHLWSADFSRPDFSVPPWLVALGPAVVVCNASDYRPSGLGDVERFGADMALHLEANVALLHALRPAADRTGRPGLRSVVGITDIAVERAPVGHLAYTVAKGALQTLLLALANEWAPQVRVNVVQPGTLPFPPDWDDPGRTRRILDSIPLGRIGSFEELAAVVAFLALDASYVTGQVLAVDGGRSRRLD